MARKPPRRGWRRGSIFRTKSGLFGIRWYEDGQRKKRYSLPDRPTAEQVLDEIEKRLKEGLPGIPLPLRSYPTLATLADDWLARRKKTHRAAYDDECRWRLHLRPHFGELRAADVDAARIRAFVERKLGEGLNPATVGHCVRLLSTFYTDLCERSIETGVSENPVRKVPRSTRKLYKPTHNPKDTPHLHSMADVVKVFQAMEAPYSVAYAIGALGGLRTGEILALRWEHIDLEEGILHVREQIQNSRVGPVKDDETRSFKMQKSLVPVLKAWKVRSGGEGLLFRPDRPGRRAGRGTRAPSTYMLPRTLHERLRDALRDCSLDAEMTWYQATKHTMASLWVMNGGSLEKLAAVLGHSSTEVTRRYAHLRPDAFEGADRRILNVDLIGASGVPLQRSGAGNGTNRPENRPTAGQAGPQFLE